MSNRLKYVMIVAMIISSNVYAQEPNNQSPLSTEVMSGSRSSMYQMIVEKPFNAASPFKFFNLINYEVDYDKMSPDNYIIQTIGYYEFAKNFNAGVGGNLKAFGGFKPVASVEYTNFSPSRSIVIQPVHELDRDGAFSTLAIFEWHPVNVKKIQPYFRLQAFTAWKSEHSYSYHYWRAGMQYRTFRFGGALNVNYVGPDAHSTWNWGAFLNFLIF
jgi:hypothetical protein